MNRVSPRVLALLAALTLVWGTNWPLFKIALDELPVLTFRAVVLVIATLVLTAVLLARGESFAVPRGKWAALIAASAMNLFIWNIATSLAVLYIPSGHASVLAYTMPLWVALLGFAVFGQRLTARLLLAIAIGAAAVVALMIPNFQSYARAPAGLFWGLFAGFCWAVGTFVVKRTAWPGMGLSLTFWQVVISLPPILLGALVIDGPPTHWPSTKALVATIYTGAVPMALGTAAWFALVKLLPAQVAALSSIAIPSWPS
jgi:drug/metabolite transporter (DMT)-like permease